MGQWESTGQSNDWYTPPHVFKALGCNFNLDVAAPAIGGHVPAISRLVEHGLETDWYGFVWMNPPFGGRNALEPWLEKFIEHGDGIALTPDRTSAPWFQKIVSRSDALLFTPKLRFLRPDGSEGKSPSNGTALIAMGSCGVAALRRAARAGLGFMVIPV